MSDNLLPKKISIIALYFISSEENVSQTVALLFKSPWTATLYVPRLGISYNEYFLWVGRHSLQISTRDLTIFWYYMISLLCYYQGAYFCWLESNLIFFSYIFLILVHWKRKAFFTLFFFASVFISFGIFTVEMMPHRTNVKHFEITALVEIGENPM